MPKLELILIALLSSCIHSTKFQDNLNYLRTLQTEEVFRDLNGIYYKTTDSKGNCRIEFDFFLPLWEDSYFGQLNTEDQQTTIRLYKEHCLKIII